MCNYIPEDEWLEEAKKVPIGQSRRVYHGAEHRPNMVVYNNQDSWSCYCHRCHKGGYKQKAVPKLSFNKVPSTGLKVPEGISLIEVMTSYTSESIIYYSFTMNAAVKDSIAYLLRYNISANTLGRLGIDAFYSTEMGRLIFKYRDCYISRAMLGQEPKWYIHSMPEPMHLQGNEGLILTEDLLSAIRIRAVTGCSCIPVLGTNLTDAIMIKCTHYKQVQIAFDGDSAGLEGARKTFKALRLLGVNCTVKLAPNGLDPKDLTDDMIIALWGCHE